MPEALTKPTPRKNPRLKLVYPVRDQIQAMRTCPEYLRCLALWQSILKKEKRGLPLTEKEAALKYNAPRSRSSVEAETEARENLLTRTYRQLGVVSEAAWAWRYAPSPELDEVNQRLNVSIPVDLPFTAIGPHLERLVQQAKGQLQLPSPQRVRRPDVDPWRVYRLRHQRSLSLLQITWKLFDVPETSPTYDPDVKRAYEKVVRAYQYAVKVRRSKGLS